MKFARLLPFALIMALLPGAACSRRPKGVVSDSKMVDIMADMKLADAYLANYPGSPSDSLGIRLADDILAKHGVSRADFDSTLVWYGRNFDDYAALSERVERRLTQKQKDYIGEMSSESGTDLWPYSRHLVLSSLGTSDVVSFSINAPELNEGDAIQWKMRLNSDADGRLFLGVDYADGSSSYIYDQTGARRRLELNLITDSVMQVKRLYGWLRADSRFMPLWIDSISLTHRSPSSDERVRTSFPNSYRLPEKFDPIKAAKKAKVDSLRRQSERDSIAKASSNLDSEQKADGEGFGSGLLRHSRKLNSSRK